jgi:hypothetical protein
MADKNTKKWTPKKKALVIGSVVAIGAIALATTLVVILLKKKSSGSANLNLPSVCPTASRVPLYVFAVVPGGQADMFTTETSGDDVIQNDGEPIYHICPETGSGRSPLYKYVNPDDPGEHRWGTSHIAPEGYQLDNDGVPYGYIFNTSTVGGQTLVPVKELTCLFNDGLTTASVLGTDTTTYNGFEDVVGQTLGYAFPGTV